MWFQRWSRPLRSATSSGTLSSRASMSHQAPICPIHSQLLFTVVLPRGALMSSRFDQPKLDLSSRVTACSHVSFGSTGGVFDGVIRERSGLLRRRGAGRVQMWCPLLEAVYHYSVGGYLAMCMCHRSEAALLQSCHFALFVNLVARASIDRFFASCDVPLAAGARLAGRVLATQA